MASHGQNWELLPNWVLVVPIYKVSRFGRRRSGKNKGIRLLRLYIWDTKKVEMDAKYLVQEIRSRPFFINSKEKHAKASENSRQVQLHFGQIIFHIWWILEVRKYTYLSLHLSNQSVLNNKLEGNVNWKLRILGHISFLSGEKLLATSYSYNAIWAKSIYFQTSSNLFFNKTT